MVCSPGEYPSWCLPLQVGKLRGRFRVSALIRRIFYGEYLEYCDIPAMEVTWALGPRSPWYLVRTMCEWL